MASPPAASAGPPPAMDSPLTGAPPLPVIGAISSDAEALSVQQIAIIGRWMLVFSDHTRLARAQGADPAQPAKP